MKTQWLKPEPKIKLGDHVFFSIAKRKSYFGYVVGRGHTLMFGRDVFLISYRDEYNNSKTRWVAASKVQPDLWYKGDYGREQEHSNTQVAERV
jgi:hypothetical protein